MLLVCAELKSNSPEPVRQPPHVKLQHANLAAELESVFALDPAYCIVDLEYVIGKLGITAIVHLVVGTAPFYAWKGGVIYASEPDLVRVSLTETVRNFTAETAAEAEESLVNERRGRKRSCR